MSEGESKAPKWYKRISFNFLLATDRTFLYSDLLLLLIIIAIFIFMSCAANITAEFDKGGAEWALTLYDTSYDGYDFRNDSFLTFLNDYDNYLRFIPFGLTIAVIVYDILVFKLHPLDHFHFYLFIILVIPLYTYALSYWTLEILKDSFDRPRPF